MERYFNKVIEYAIENNYSDLHLDIENYDLSKFSAREYGKVKLITKMDNNTSNKFMNYVLFIANIDVVNTRSMKTGIIKYQYKNREFFLRVSVVFALYSKSIVIRILNNHKKIYLNNLTFIKNNYNDLKKILTYNSGLVLFSGKTGSGKTTTMYALVEEMIRTQNKKIISLEDPIEREIDGMLQISVNSEIISYFDVLKQVLRHDPDIIIIGEIRDENDLKLAIQASLSGHLVIASIHALNALYTINRMLDLKVNKYDLKACLKLISYQELFYRTKDKQAFCIYEIIKDDVIAKYIDNENIDYLKINDYRMVLEKRMNFYEAK